MANQWCRLWNDMPADLKWLTIARKSGQRVGDVMAVYVFLMVSANKSSKRGIADDFKPDDVAGFLQIDEQDVNAIINAMQGKVLDGMHLTGWEKRQPLREDGSAERAREWREQKRTQANANERPDTDTDKESDTDTEGETSPPIVPPEKGEQRERATTLSLFERFWAAYPKKKSKGQAEKTWAKLKVDEQLLTVMLAAIERAKKSADWQKNGGQYIPYPSTWLNAKGWLDEYASAQQNYGRMAGAIAGTRAFLEGA
jgi:ribosomal protein L12E/L44/L45/RPP1/RPP2